MISESIKAETISSGNAPAQDYACAGIWHRSGNNQYYACLPKLSSSGGVLVALGNGPTSAALSSLGGPAELLRVTGVLELIQLLTFKQYSARSGTWTTGNPAFGQDGSGGVNNGQVHNRTTAQNAYCEYTVTIPADGVLRIGFYGSAGSSASVEVSRSIDDFSTSAVIDTFAINTTTGLIKKQWSGIATGACKIRVTKKDAGSLGLNVYGPNFWDVTDFGSMPNGIDVDAYGYFRTVVGQNYITNTGACDYAIFNHDTSLWGGSYHGGETSQLLVMTVGGVDVTSMANGAFVAGRNINIRQSTIIDWGSGITLSPVVRTDFCRGGWGLHYRITGSGVGTWEDWYPVMTTTSTAFDQVTAPVSATITPDTVTDFGGIKNMTQRNSTTGQTLQSLWSAVNHANNAAGANVTAVTGSYNKLYDGLIVDKNSGVALYAWEQTVIRLCN